MSYDSNSVVVRYVPETTYNVTPVDSANWKTLRYLSENFTASAETVQSAEIRQDRAIPDLIKTNTSVTGGFNFELSANTWDEFIEATLGGTWAQDGVNLWDIVEQGTTYRSFSVEKEFGDLTTPEFLQQKGMRVGTMGISLAFGQIVTGSVGMAGADAVTAQTSLVGTGSTAAATTTAVMNASSDVGSIKVNGLETTMCLTGLDLNFDNNLRAINCIGSDTPEDQKWGTLNITGTATIHLDNAAFDLYKDALANNEASIEYTVTDGVNSLMFFLPRIKLSAEAPQVGGQNQDVTVTVNFTALQDSVEGTPIRVRRTPNVV